MKIGIITFHFAYNYGAVLQAWALKTYLNKIGHNVEIIDYRPKYHTERYNVIRSLRTSVKVAGKEKGGNLFQIIKAVAGTALENLTQLRVRMKKKKQFELFFTNYFSLSNRQYHTIDDLRKEVFDYDMMIAGSDQIWNSKLTNNSFDPAYFLDFGPKTSKRVLFGVSFGETPVVSGVNYIKRKNIFFDRYSCRELKDAKELSSMLQVPCTLVPDPTFLLSAGDYSIIEEIPVDNNYCLVYMLRRNDILENVADMLTKKGYTVLNVSPFGISVKKTHHLYPLSPASFIGYIKNAEMVITNSFHGVAFSIIYRKNFVCGLHGNRNTRILNILNETGLESRIVTDINSLDKLMKSNIDYKMVSQKIEYLSERGKNFLYDALTLV